MATKPIPETFDPIKTAYFAGIVDGEGYVGVMRTRYTRKDGLVREHPMIQVAMTHEETVLALWEHFGGYCSPRLQRVTKNHKYVYRWQVSWRSAKIVAGLLLPYSITKREALQKVLDCVVHIRGPKGRFSDEQIKDIRSRHTAGEFLKDIAKIYNISAGFAGRIADRTWYKSVK